MRQLFLRASASAAVAAALACSALIGRPYSGAGGDAGSAPAAGPVAEPAAGPAAQTAAPIINAITMRIGILSLPIPRTVHPQPPPPSRCGRKHAVHMPFLRIRGHTAAARARSGEYPAKIGELRQGQQGCSRRGCLRRRPIRGNNSQHHNNGRRYATRDFWAWPSPLLAIITAGAPTAAFGQPNCRNTGQLRQVAGRIQTRGRRPEDFRLGDRRRLAVPEIRSAHHQYRPRAAVLRAELPRLLQEADPGLPARSAAGS